MLRIKSVKEALRSCSYHVDVKLSGGRREQFINICLRRKLDLWNVKVGDKVTTFTMTATAFRKNVRQIVRKTGTRAIITGRGGLYHKFKNYRMRIPLALYGVFGALVILHCSSFVWSVNVSGGDLRDRELALDILKANGVTAGASLRDIDTKDLAEKIIIDSDNIKWAGITKKGTVLNVELLNTEEYRDGEALITGPRHLVAKKDALILKIVTESGTAVVPENSVILEGETIISGLVYPVDEIYGTEPRLVSATGSVIGLVKYSVSVPVETEVTLYDTDGNTATSRAIRIFGKTINFGKNPPFESYNTISEEKNFALDYLHLLPISVINTTYYETIARNVTLNDAEALEFAEISAMRLLDDKIPDDSKVVKTGREMRVVDGVTCYCIWAECEESIGEYVRVGISEK